MPPFRHADAERHELMMSRWLMMHTPRRQLSDTL